MTRPKNAPNVGVLKWDVSIINVKNGNVIKDLGKYCSLPEFNKKNDTNFTTHKVWKLQRLQPEDITDERLKNPNSFVSKYSHFKFTRINEPLELKYIRVRMDE